MKRKIFRTFFSILLIGGIGTMFYPKVSKWINDRHQDEAVRGYIETTEGYADETLAEMKREAIRYNEKLASGTIAMTDPFEENLLSIASDDYDKTLKIDEAGLMGIITIDAINLRAPIYHGTSEEVLSKAVGHLQGTSLPIGGSSTHSVLSAHTGLVDAKLFTDLDKVEEGDIFTITVLDEEMAYKVYDVAVVLPSEISSVIIKPERDLCTLVTCTPYGINSHRLLVLGERIELPRENVIKEEEEEDSGQKPWMYVGIYLVIMIVLLIWYKKVR